MTNDCRNQSRRFQVNRRVTDRRDQMRLPAESTIRFMLSDCNQQEVLHGPLIDVSSHGLQIVFDERLDVGETLLIEVRGDDSRCFNSTVRVMRVDETTKNYQNVGCEFCVQLSRRQIATLKQLTLVATAG